MKNNCPLISIVSVNYRNAEVTADMLRSLEALSYPEFEVLLVDNGMETNQSAFFRNAFSGTLKIIESKDNLGFAGGTNLGIRNAAGDYILLLNSDTVVPPGFLQPLVEVLQNNRQVGMVCPKIYFYDHPNVIQYAGATAINKLTGRGAKLGFASRDEGKYEGTHPTQLGNGACMLVRREVFEKVGLLSELYFMYYEEHDFTERARRAGWTMYYCGASHIHHRQSISIGKSNPRKLYYLVRNRLLFIRRFSSSLQLFFFLLYFLLISLPKELIHHLLRFEFRHILHIFRGIAWNFSHAQIKLSNEKITL